MNPAVHLVVSWRMSFHIVFEHFSNDNKTAYRNWIRTDPTYPIDLYGSECLGQTSMKMVVVSGLIPLCYHRGYFFLIAGFFFGLDFLGGFWGFGSVFRCRFFLSATMGSNLIFIF